MKWYREVKMVHTFGDSMNIRAPIVVVAALVGIALCPARGADADSIKDRLFEAKKAFDVENQKFRKSITEILDKREDDARKVGNKKIVDQVKAERELFEKTGELPAGLPSTVTNSLTSARVTLEKAYSDAVKGYIQIKEDAAAEATEKELQKFAVDSALAFGKKAYLTTLKHNDLKDGKNWFTDNGMLCGGGAKIKRDGQFVPHSIHMYPPSAGSAEVRYQLTGKWSAFRTSVGVPKVEDKAEPPASQITFEVLGDGKSLWKSQPVTKLDTFQTCELQVSKVKVLALVVHCPMQNHWARCFWFEPILAE